MDSELIRILETLGYEVILQGSLDINVELPNAYFTYWNWQSPRTKHYDNKHSGVIYYYQIQFYSNDISIIDTTLNNAIKLLEDNGFELEEEPIDDYSDIPNYTVKSIEIHKEKRR